MHKLVVVLCIGLPCLMAVTAAVPAQPISTRNAKVDALFAKWDKTDSPGLALAVVKDGKTVYQRGYGMANLELGLSITTSTVFLIASLSKHFTVFCILLLLQGGRLNLDDDVRQHVPEVPDFGKKITVRHLIHHTSGLREYLPLASYAGWRSGDALIERDVLDLVAKQKELNFEPGSQYLYCNTAYELLGLIVKRVSGKSLRDFARENVFEPLGMRHTQFRDDYRMLVKDWAASYTPRPFGGFQYGLVHHGLAGASNVHTTVEDLAIWDRNFYDARVGGKELIEQMHEKFTLTGGKQIDYAGGLRVNKYRGLKTVDHTGSHGGFRTILLRFPDQKFSVILLANCSDVNTIQLARKVADIYLENQLDPLPKKDKTSPTVKVDAALLERYAGEYLFEAGFLAKVTKSGDKLSLTTPLGPQLLEPLSPTEFVNETGDTRLVFSQSEHGVNVVLVGDIMELPARRLQPIQVTDDERKQFAGDYYSDELEVFFHVVDRDGKLWLRHRKGEFSLRPTATDEFSGDFGDYGGFVTLRFLRNGEKQINGFLLGSGRVKGLKFVRAQIKPLAA